MTAEASWITGPQVVEGSRASLECNIDGGSVEKEVKWLFTGENVQKEIDVDPRNPKFISRGFSKHDKGLLYDLNILATIEDSGLYMCEILDKGDNQVCGVNQ